MFWERDSWKRFTSGRCWKNLACAVSAWRPKRPSPVAYKGKHVGTYAADLVVEDRLLVEVKCVDQFSTEHLAQCLNYLKASGLHLALLINFRRPKVEWRRVVRDL